MTAGFYSPLPPARTGVADYAAALLAALRRLGRVEVNPSTCDVALYHLGNNALHADAYRRALERPGVIALHDAVLHHFLLGELDEASYIEEFVYNYGEWNRSLAAQLWRGRAASGADTRYFAFPMLRRVAERSRAIVVHNPEAARMVLAEAPGVRVVEIPHLFAPAPGPGEAEALRYRQRLGVPAGAFLFGVFGYLRESKRLETILRVFSDVRRSHGEACLLVAGDFVSTDLERAVAPLLKAPGVIRRPFLKEREFRLAAAAVDACINLKCPSAGETSGITVRMMGLGKPVLATDGPEISRIPEDAVLRISSGVAERESLLVHMRLLISVNDAAGAIGRRASAYISELHSVERAASQYWKLLCDCCA